MSPGPSVFVTPRAGPPYQELLYREFASAGVRVRYSEGPTRSQTLNLILAPAVLAGIGCVGIASCSSIGSFSFLYPGLDAGNGRGS